MAKAITFSESMAHFFGRASRIQKNRAFRYKSSDLPMQILWAFRCNPIARAAAANQGCKNRPEKSHAPQTHAEAYFV
jgi:hypothetical protein